jgi:hypothetical protein
MLDQKFTLTWSYKTKKNIDYMLNYLGEVPIFVTKNHVLRQTMNKFEYRFFIKIY